MGARNWGNPPIWSTASGTGTDPSTTALLAELTGLVDALYEVRFIVGASTSAFWVFEHALSSGVTSTSFRERTHVFTGTGQSAEYVLTYKAETGDRFRVRVNSSFSGTWAADLQAERLT